MNDVFGERGSHVASGMKGDTNNDVKKGDLEGGIKSGAARDHCAIVTRHAPAAILWDAADAAPERNNFV